MKENYDGVDLGPVPELMEQQRLHNMRRIDHIAHSHGPAAGWPVDLARHYLAELLSYELGAAQLDAIELFFERCHRLGLIDRLRPLRLYGDTGTAARPQLGPAATGTERRPDERL